jgi:hypothetical protein
MFNSSMVNDCVQVFKCHVGIDLQQFCLFNKKVPMLGIAK